MADINSQDIKIMQSQRLDDSKQGGGQMTSNEVISGQISNLYPDISRLDRVYGRVSMRKAYLAVQTDARQTYYGSHSIITEQAKDPLVSVCMFSTEDWFDVRENAKDRIEAYLVKGPQAQMALWGNHYKGTASLSYFTNENWPSPEIGDVLVIKDDTNEQYMRVTDLSNEIMEFFDGNNAFFRKIMSITIGSQLEYDFEGTEVIYSPEYTTFPTKTYTTVAADASRYYGVSTLSEDVAAGELQIRVNDIQTQLVPSASSETAIVDAGVGSAVSPMIQTNTADVKITRNVNFDISPNAKLHIGEGIIPGTFSWTGGVNLNDGDGKGNIYSGSTIVGSIVYATGIITFGNPGVTTTGTGSATYKPACTINQISQTGGIIIETNNRGFVYTFSCNPLPQKGTVKVDYISGGKWYSIWDQGNGQLSGSDDSIGSGSVNFNTGSISMTLGAMPDAESKIIIYWAKPAEYYDLSGETLPLEYIFFTNNEGVARNTFSVTWGGNLFGAFDDGNGILTYREWITDTWVETGVNVGSIKYATGEINLIPSPTYAADFPTATENFTVKYNYGAPEIQSFFAPPRDGSGHITVNITNTPIIPKTFKITWHNYVVEYDPETRIDVDRDPTYIFYDDGAGNFDGDVNDGTTGWIKGTVDYATGEVLFHPDRTTVFPFANYEWVDSEWLHPGVVQTRVFKDISYLPALSYFPTEGTVEVSYCTTDGSNQDEYSGNLEPRFVIKQDKTGLEIIPGGLSVDFNNQYIIDGGNGKLYTHIDGVDGDKIEVGDINYVMKTFTITSDSIDMSSVDVLFCSGSGQIEPMQSMVFRAPGAPIRPGSAFIKGTTGEGTLIEGSTDFSGEISGTGITGHVDFNTGLCHVAFGEWVTDDAEAQAQDWYNSELAVGGIVWKPFVVRASTILINCVITSYLPLDPDLLGLNPVRLPLDGRVPIFRDGYIIVIHHPLEEYMPNPLGIGDTLPADLTLSVGRTNVDLIEAYSMPTAAQISEGTQVVPIYISEVGNYTFDLDLGEITFLTGFEYPKDDYGTLNQIIALSRIEDMCLASDVQVTGHIAVTSPITHSYVKDETIVSSVLPSGDLQSRAYNEFEQEAWTQEWSDTLIGIQPLASYNFVDYPITVTNTPSIKERWLFLFSSPTTISIVGENFGVLAENVSISIGNAFIGGNNCIAVENKQFPGQYYFVIRCDGFGSGWASGNCIRFNTDPANFPLWFVRTTKQGPMTEPIDYYTLMARGDSS